MNTNELRNFSEKLSKNNDNEILMESDNSELNETELSVDLITPVELKNQASNNNDEYFALKKLEDQDLIQSGSFDCPSCKIWIETNDGVLLRECFHSFCKPCLRKSILEDESMACLEKQCCSTLEHREVRGLLTKEEFEFFLDGSLKSYQNKKDTSNEENEKGMEISPQNENQNLGEEFLELIKLDNQDIVRCYSFNCLICLQWIEANDGIMLRQCFHKFCIKCLQKFIENSTDAEIQCPDSGDKCSGILEQREIRGLISTENFDRFLQRSIHMIDDDIEFIPTEKTIKMSDEVHSIELDGPQPGCSKYLYANNQSKSLPILTDNQNINRIDSFNCSICHVWVEHNEGIILKQCLHTFCEKCLIKIVLNYAGPVIVCPDEKCESTLERGEIKALMTREQFDEFLSSSLDINAYQNTEIFEKVDYFRLIELEDLNLVRYGSEFECPICLNTIKSGSGIILKNCLHIFCEECLMGAIRSSTGMDVECPNIDENAIGCKSHLTDSEIKYLLPLDEHSKFVERQLRLTEQILPTVHCAKPNCPGFYIIDNINNDYIFICEVCKSQNCIRCKAIHINMTCEEYKNPERYSTSKIDEMIERDEAMRCPRCTAVITRIDGCEGMTCGICKIAICWATKGARWGPNGQGDTSGGCRCKVFGKRCHPNCINCH